jgi:hypothetical protein
MHLNERERERSEREKEGESERERTTGSQEIKSDWDECREPWPYLALMTVFKFW